MARFIVNILNGKENDGQDVILNINAIVPKTNLQTTTARRKKFHNTMEEMMAGYNWLYSW